MSDAQILTVAIAIIVPVSTLFAGIFIQDHRAQSLRAEVVDALKEIRLDVREIRTEIREMRSQLNTIEQRVK
jgi:hypothetical protein